MSYSFEKLGYYFKYTILHTDSETNKLTHIAHTDDAEKAKFLAAAADAHAVVEFIMQQAFQGYIISFGPEKGFNGRTWRIRIWRYARKRGYGPEEAEMIKHEFIYEWDKAVNKEKTLLEILRLGIEELDKYADKNQYSYHI